MNTSRKAKAEKVVMALRTAANALTRAINRRDMNAMVGADQMSRELDRVLGAIKMKDWWPVPKSNTDENY